MHGGLAVVSTRTGRRECGNALGRDASGWCLITPFPFRGGFSYRHLSIAGPVTRTVPTRLKQENLP
jgi:hypothetical protein